ncbi:SpoIIE family protein phosphatase [Streptomyces calidiresistens]|uniref:SpoIIE family protein phosphatase n=1 Tax=Streptomyces calidiresistens TaxID=1485586 RepID=A0A7W3XVI4_9ACTN|nr:SpoIIE family protein phosphatase [Streptomyces calidiresistens]MBB0229010.1 SpoIIE family protein phosphatase [Streptomyces calidiresistens]
MPQPLTEQIRIDHESAVQHAGSVARSTAFSLGWSDSLAERAAVVAGELAGNLAKHASQGVIYLQPLPPGDAMEIIAVDRGPGMLDLALCLTDGYSTAGTLGGGLGAVRRIAQEFTIRTERGTGTVASARLAVPGRPAGDPGLGAVCLPVEGERVGGDAWRIDETDGVRTVVLVDALGHGETAAEVARAAVRVHRRDPSRPLPEVLTALNKGLRHTRGAAVAVLRTERGRTEWCGVGNIRCRVVSPDGTIASVASGPPGVVGWNMPRPMVRRVESPPGSTIVLHSDGIDDRWIRSPSPFLLRLPPPLLAAALTHAHRIARDDSTVLTIGTRRTHDL